MLKILKRQGLERGRTFYQINHGRWTPRTHLRCFQVVIFILRHIHVVYIHATKDSYSHSAHTYTDGSIAHCKKNGGLDANYRCVYDVSSWSFQLLPCAGEMYHGHLLQSSSPCSQERLCQASNDFWWRGMLGERWASEQRWKKMNSEQTGWRCVSLQIRLENSELHWCGLGTGPGHFSSLLDNFRCSQTVHHKSYQKIEKMYETSS